jgi:hypothetical protein
VFKSWSLALTKEQRLRLLRRIFGRKREEVVGDWRRLHYEELHNLDASLNIIMVIRLRRMGWAGNVTRMGKRTNTYDICFEILKERDHL